MAAIYYPIIRVTTWYDVRVVGGRVRAGNVLGDLPLKVPLRSVKLRETGRMHSINHFGVGTTNHKT